MRWRVRNPALPLASLGLLLLSGISCGSGGSGSNAPPANTGGPTGTGLPAPGPGTSGTPAGAHSEEGIYSSAELAQVPPPRGRDRLDPRLAGFLGDPGFHYDFERDYDLGLEAGYRVFFLDPGADHAFLGQLHRDFPAEVADLDAVLFREVGLHAFRLDHNTSFRDVDIALLLRASAQRPRRRELMRRVLYHLLTGGRT